jgi:RimJ/RimL family protein N-acetyltransferase
MNPTPFLAPLTLAGSLVHLEPLAPEHTDDLVQAASDGALWTLWFTSVPAPQATPAYIRDALAMQAAGTALPFIVRRASDGRIVGCTRLCNADAKNRRVEIGYTWYSASVQRSGLNTEAKLLLLQHAFETLGCIAVELRTHHLNHTSRRAIERLGARLDGILRHHQRLPNGSLRDTCVYSITAPEWPAVAAHLRWQLANSR